MWKRILFCMGIIFLLYPVVHNVVTKTNDEKAIEKYEKQVRELDMETISVPTYTDVIGWIEIPKINVKLPVYHGTDEKVLTKGVGHVTGSSFPGGGKGTHCFLAGHRGLPRAELFARLGELKAGDIFYMHVLGEIMVYEVQTKVVVEPDNTEIMKRQSGHDLISLITCTPYGINTHRLVVTGERKENG